MPDAGGVEVKIEDLNTSQSTCTCRNSYMYVPVRVDLHVRVHTGSFECHGTCRDLTYKESSDRSDKLRRKEF